MAVAYEIKGKTLLRQNGGNTIGQSGDDDKVTITIENFERQIHTSESGPEMPAKIIDLGKKARVRYPMIEYDRAELTTIRKTNSGESTVGQIGNLGTDRTLFDLEIVPATSGATQVRLSKARVLNVAEEDWGLMESKVVLEIEGIVDPAALSTATSTLFVESTIA